MDHPGREESWAMSGGQSPSYSDLAEALAGISDRQGRPGDAAAIRRMVLDRGPKLGCHVRQLVRLVRLMALCSSKHYTEALYVRVRLFTAANFRRAVSESTPSTHAVCVEANRVVFLEPAMRSETQPDKPFDLSFAQMPRLAILLDLLHNSMGHAATESHKGEGTRDLFRPILGAEPAISADEVARRVHSALETWLSQALTTSEANRKPSTLVRKAKTIGSFLIKRSKWRADAIDDDQIFAFWSRYASADGDFRSYKQVARSVLRYRRSLAVMEAESGSLQLGAGRGEIDLNRIAIEPLEFVDWRSPLRTLLSEPCRKVKWLKDMEYDGLANFLDFGARAVVEADGSAGSVCGPDAQYLSTLVSYIRLPDGGALMGPDRFELAFTRTLLRVDLFGPVQAAITNALRKGVDAPAAVAHGLSLADEESYEHVAGEYQRIRDQAREAALAALYHLGTEGNFSALLLVAELFGNKAQTSFAAMIRAAVAAGGVCADREAAVRTVLRDAFRRTMPAADDVSQIVAACAEVARRTTKKGFKPKERAILCECFPAAVPALGQLIAELDRLVTHARKMPLRDMAKEDRRLFGQVLHKIYGN
jgi:hypothetical protein